ncbi:MAG: hypothetical protein F6J96_09340 [Symploca sp. SIO1C2]|nr:hypothetical protein [Symploca sp. SIO1C2]
MAISNNSIQQLLPILRPYLRNESERRAYLIRALGTNADVLNLIWNEPVNTFIPNMVQALVAFGELTPGKPALCALLEVIREDVGVDIQVRLDELLQAIKKELPRTSNNQGNWSHTSVNDSNKTLKPIDLVSPRQFTTASGFLGDDWDKLEKELNDWLFRVSTSIEIKNIVTDYSLSGAKVLVYFEKKMVDHTKPYLKACIYHGLTELSVDADIYKHSKIQPESLTSNTASLTLGLGAFAVVLFRSSN